MAFAALLALFGGISAQAASRGPEQAAFAPTAAGRGPVAESHPPDALQAETTKQHADASPCSLLSSTPPYRIEVPLTVLADPKWIDDPNCYPTVACKDQGSAAGGKLAMTVVVKQTAPTVGSLSNVSAIATAGEYTITYTCEGGAGKGSQEVTVGLSVVAPSANASELRTRSPDKTDGSMDDMKVDEASDDEETNGEVPEPEALDDDGETADEAEVERAEDYAEAPSAQDGPASASVAATCVRSCCMSRFFISRCSACAETMARLVWQRRMVRSRMLAHACRGEAHSQLTYSSSVGG